MSTTTQPSIVVNGLERKERQQLLSKTVEQSFERLAEQLNKGFTEEFKEFLSFYRRFHRYSPLNTLLIQLQKPQASVVAGFNTWKAMGRKVRKGSTAAWIFVPLISKRKDEETGEEGKQLVGFGTGGVFGDCDIEDIDTNPLPSPWKPMEGDYQATLDAFVTKVEAAGIAVRFERLRSNLGGYATHGGSLIVVNDQLSPSAAIPTLIHEVTHCLLHFDSTAPVDQGEAESDAESCAYVVSGMLGLDYKMSADYLLLYRVTAKSLQDSLVRVQKATKRIVEMLDIVV